MTESELHPRGLFGIVDDVELSFYGWTSAGTFGTPVDHVDARTEDVPQGVTLVEGYRKTPGIVSIPISEVEDLRQWDWFVVFEGVRYRVVSERDGKFLISTGDSAVAAKSAEWDGNFRDDWMRWIDPSGLPVTVESHEVKLPRA